jgi:2-amino-4-hydroxy-6-hydroxymethyldihydropteridine diphosphokinase
VTLALLSLGGNLGDRRQLMDAAVDRIARIPNTRVVARSSYYKTAPDGPIAQDWFLNIGVSVETDLSRHELADACRKIEAELGRDRAREISWGPRTMDIDVVLYGDELELDERPFVVVPFAEIAPDLTVGGDALASMAARVNQGGVEKLDWPLPPIWKNRASP